jgi:long-subunit fatty acid transport protein
LQLEETLEYDWATESNYTVNPFDLISDYAQTGLGAKYQVTRKFNLELSGTYFFTSKNGGAGYTMNLGLRYII